MFPRSTTTSHPSACRRGFTLVELLVVVGIIGVLLGLLVPAFQNMGRGAGMRSAIMQVRASVALARQWAITHREKTYVVFPCDKNTYPSSSDYNLYHRSFAVFGEKSGYIKEWTYFPAGVVLDGTNYSSGAFNIASVTNGTQFKVPFPNTTSSTQDMRCVSFTPDGRLNQAGANDVGIYLMEGWVSTNPMAVSARPNGARFLLHSYRLTGRLRTVEL